MSDYYVGEIKRAIDAWASQRGLGDNANAPEHADLARHIYETIEHHYFKKAASKGVLLDVDDAGDYCNVRLVDWEGAEETLYPIDPATDEHVDTIPEI